MNSAVDYIKSIVLYENGKVTSYVAETVVGPKSISNDPVIIISFI